MAKTLKNVSTKKVLGAPLAQKLKTCLVIGFDADGTFYFASTTSDLGQVQVALVRADIDVRKMISGEF